jgi:transcriptional regulator with XRE-family HTH domain
LPGLTQREVAAALGLSERAVRNIERRAFRKLRNHPVLQAIWAQLESVPASHHVEDATNLTDEEIDALFGLVQSPLEARALAKVLTAVWTSGD